MSLPTMFGAHQRFNASCGDSWKNYLKWSGYHQITELVSTDSILCPAVIQNLVETDWEHNVKEDYKVFFFRDFEYLRERIKYDPKLHNLLAINERPTSTPESIKSFEFCGYDILDSYDSISVLTNCGGFPSIFAPSEVNHFGLLDDLNRAEEIATAIRVANPEETHCCDCRIWSLARYIGSV